MIYNDAKKECSKSYEKKTHTYRHIQIQICEHCAQGANFVHIATIGMKSEMKLKQNEKWKIKKKNGKKWWEKNCKIKKNMHEKIEWLEVDTRRPITERNMKAQQYQSYQVKRK